MKKMKVIKNIWIQDRYTDTDRDGVANSFDCQPFNPLRQDRGWKKEWDTNSGNVGWIHEKTGNKIETLFNPIKRKWYMTYKEQRWRDNFETVDDANVCALKFMYSHPKG